MLAEKEISPFGEIKTLISSDLAYVDELIIEAAKSYVELIPTITQYLTSAGGKRLRPMLTLLSSNMCGAKGKAHVYLATAVEYIHTATLLHDDVIDGSELRRGKKVANLVWSNKASILVGDYLLSQAFNLMVSADNMKALDLLSSTARSITESEIWQLDLVDKIELSIADYIKLITGKTALLFAAACSVGAILTNRPQQEIDALYNYGLNLGICFQIIDDTLDYVGTSKDFGKVIGNDLKEGKVTLPFIFAYQNASPNQKKYLTGLIENKDEDLSELYEILKLSNAIESSKAEAMKYVAAGLHNLEMFNDNKYLQALKNLITYLPNRIK